MKQQTVIKVQLNCDKCRTKAMKLVASAEGVDSVAIQGDERNEVVVIGEGVDSIRLTSMLRKKVGQANIISVGEVKKQVDGKDSNSKEPAEVGYPLQWYPPSSQLVVHDGFEDQNPNTCSIM